VKRVAASSGVFQESRMGAQIRPADAADAAVIALLGRITFGETFGHLFRDHQDDLRAYLDRTDCGEPVIRMHNRLHKIRRVDARARRRRVGMALDAGKIGASFGNMG
jgi:hypothetical protein